MAEEKDNLTTRDQALRVARMLGCQGAHETEKGWMPCLSHEEYEAIKKGKEEYLKVLAAKKKKPLPKMVQRTKRLETKSDAYYENRADAVAISKARGCGGVRTVLLAGKKYYAVCNHKAPKRGWENLDEKPISGIATLPGGGLVTGSFSGKSLGRPIGGVADFDGDGDGFLTGPDGEDNIPVAPSAIANSKKKMAKDITKQLAKLFGKDAQEFKKSDGGKEYDKRLSKIKNDVKPDIQLEMIAEMQGFTGLPKVVSSSEMASLEKKGWTIAYRGIASIVDTENDEVIVEAKDLADGFRKGDYFAGLGAHGNGIHFSLDRESAEVYAEGGFDDQGNLRKGEVIKVAIPPDFLMERDEFSEEVTVYRERVKKGITSFYGDDDIGRVLVSKGVRGSRLNLRVSNGFVADVAGSPVSPNVILILDRSMLAVEGSAE
jgi:hypothetical protein